MPPEIGLLALVLAVPAFILALRTRVELFGGRRERRSGRHPHVGGTIEADPVLDRLAGTLERIEADQRALARRLENLETIVTSDPTRTAGPLLSIPPAEPSAAEDAERLARRLRGG